jgi:hypothetical protein
MLFKRNGEKIIINPLVLILEDHYATKLESITLKVCLGEVYLLGLFCFNSPSWFYLRRRSN